MLTNPIILAVVIGFGWSSVGVALPGAAAWLIDLVAAAAAPCALFVLGASLSGLRLGPAWREGFVIVTLKLLALPRLLPSNTPLSLALDALPFLLPPL